MLGIVNFPFFVVAVLLLNATPGPDTAYIVGRSVAQGRTAGLMSALGISGGCCVHTLACAFGLTALLAASATAFTIVKIGGAIYLIYLGIRLLMTRDASATSAHDSVPVVTDTVDTETATDAISDVAAASNAATTSYATAVAPAVGAPSLQRAAEKRPLRRLFLQGFWTNVLNPKVVLFFVSFFPQFVAVDAPHKALPFLALGAVFVLMSTVWNGTVAMLAAGVTRRMSGKPSVKRWIDRIVGSAFVCLGIRLATMHR